MHEGLPRAKRQHSRTAAAVSGHQRLTCAKGCLRQALGQCARVGTLAGLDMATLGPASGDGTGLVLAEKLLPVPRVSRQIFVHNGGQRPLRLDGVDRGADLGEARFPR